jgi:hypothetical protein
MQTRPADGVERLGKVKLEDDAGSAAAEAGLHELRRVDKVLEDAAAGQESSLVDVDQVTNPKLKPRGEHLTENLDGAILEGDQAENTRVGGARLLGEQHNVHAVDAAEVDVAGVQSVEEAQDRIPRRAVEARAKPIGTGSA